MCEDDTGKIDIIYFNSREGYLRKIFPLNETVIISGKVNFFRNKYQITIQIMLLRLITKNM